MKELIKLFLVFFKIGVTTFGGGYAMLPIIRREIVEKHGMATDEEVMDYYAVGQCTPGVIAVNTATFIGNKHRGFWGALAATVGVVTPAVIIITLLAAFMKNFAQLEVVSHAMGGIRAVVCALITSAVVKLFKVGIKDAFGIIVFLISLFCMILFDIPSTVFVVCSAIAGIVISVLRREKA